MPFRSVEERTQFEAGLKPFANQEEVRHFLYPCIPVHSRTFSRRNRERLDRAQPYTPKRDCARTSFHAGIVTGSPETARFGDTRVLSRGNREPLLADGFSNLNAALRIGKAVQRRLSVIEHRDAEML